MSRTPLAIILLVCLITVVPESGQEIKQPGSAAPASGKTIPVEIPITNQIYVQARINNSEPMWFILDTGATWTILDVDKAKELKISSEGNRTLDLGQTHTVTTTFAQDASLDISGIRVPVERLAVMPAKFRHAPQIVGLIGADLFKRFVVEIDYVARSIKLFEPKNYEYRGHGEKLPFEIIEQIPHIVVNVSKGNVNSLPAKLLLDTGASQTILLYSPFVDKHKLLETTEGTIKLAAGGLGGGSFVYKGRAKEVKLGKVVFEDPLIDFSTTRGAADRRDGIIGNGLLNRFKMIVDYLRRQVILEPTAQLNVSTDFDFFFFKIIQNGNTYKIGDMLQTSKAGKAGLKVGDVLLAIDGKQVSSLSLSEIQRMFMMDGRDRVLSVKRGEETLEVKLETYRIF